MHKQVDTQARQNLLVSFFPLDSVIVTTLLSFPNKSWSFSTQFSHLSKATSRKTNPGGSLWGMHFFPTKRPYGLMPDTHGCMVRRKCSLVFVRTTTVTMPVFLQCVWLWFENGTATGKTEGSEILLFQWNTCPIHDSKLWRSAGGKHRTDIWRRIDHCCKDGGFLWNAVYVEGFVNSPWAGVILMAGSKKAGPGCYIYADFADSASAKVCGLLNTQNSQSSQRFQEQHLASCCQLQ